MPLNIIGKHTEKEVRPHVILGAMPYGTDKDLDSLNPSSAVKKPRSSNFG